MYQTRKQEITEQEYDSLSDDEKRLYQRKLTKQGNYTLQKVASNAGVKNMAEFHNAGYKELYNGETADGVFKRKRLPTPKKSLKKFEREKKKIEDKTAERIGEKNE